MHGFKRKEHQTNSLKCSKFQSLPSLWGQQERLEVDRGMMGRGKVKKEVSCRGRKLLMYVSKALVIFVAVC